MLKYTKPLLFDNSGRLILEFNMILLSNVCKQLNLLGVFIILYNLSTNRMQIWKLIDKELQQILVTTVLQLFAQHHIVLIVDLRQDILDHILGLRHFYIYILDLGSVVLDIFLKLHFLDLVTGLGHF